MNTLDLYYANNKQHYQQQTTITQHIPQYIPNYQPVYTAGISNLLTVATPLIILMTKLKNSHAQPKVEVIYKQVLQEIRSFNANAQLASIPAKTIAAASYCLCAAFDETILGTAWGANSSWSQHTLLCTTQKETWGGERFYTILNKMAENPANNLDILELIYVLLSLGFEGKYCNEQKEIRDEIRYSLFNLIRNYRESPHNNLSPTAIDARVTTYNAQRHIPLWYIFAITTILMIITAIIFNFLAFSHATPLLDSLKNTNHYTTVMSKHNEEIIK